MTYSESANLMNDMTFKGRVKVAALVYADAIVIEATNVPAHSTRLRWAQQCIQNPDQMSNQLTPPVCMDANVKDKGANVDDATLQGAVEAVVNKTI